MAKTRPSWDNSDAYLAPPFSALHSSSKTSLEGSGELGSAATCQARKYPVRCRRGKVEQVTDLYPSNSFELLLENGDIMNPKSGRMGTAGSSSQGLSSFYDLEL